MNDRPKPPEWMKHPSSAEYRERMHWGARAGALADLLRARDWHKISDDHEHDQYVQYEYRIPGTSIAMIDDGSFLVDTGQRFPRRYPTFDALINDLLQIEMGLLEQ